MSGRTPPRAIFLAGPNGAGKSTMLRNLPLDDDVELVLADPIAFEYQMQGMSVFKSNVQAGRDVIRRMNQLQTQRKSFLHETNLAGRHALRRIGDLSELGYFTEVTFVGLRSDDLAVARVARRVAEGGHEVAEEVVRRRWAMGLRIFLGLCTTAADAWSMYDTEDGITLVAVGGAGVPTRVVHRQLWSEYHALIRADHLGES